jgi:hypothetical protein|nr:MAG TPA: hypothetical protein [Caudoviricetes sp.]
MKVKSTTADITYEMTEDQIEAAYRYQEEHYREMDAKRFIDERLAWLDDDKDAFEKEYGVSYDDVIEDVNYLAGRFMDEFDCNVPENEIWDEVLGEYFGPVIEEDGE